MNDEVTWSYCPSVVAKAFRHFAVAAPSTKAKILYFVANPHRFHSILCVDCISGTTCTTECVVQDCRLLLIRSDIRNRRVCQGAFPTIPAPFVIFMFITATRMISALSHNPSWSFKRSVGNQQGATITEITQLLCSPSPANNPGRPVSSFSRIAPLKIIMMEIRHVLVRTALYLNKVPICARWYWSLILMKVLS